MSGYAVRRTLPGGDAAAAGAAVGGLEPNGWPTRIRAAAGGQGGAGPPGRPGPGFHFEMGAPPEGEF